MRFRNLTIVGKTETATLNFSESRLLQISPMNFTQIEKIAVLKILQEVIIADGKVDDRELNYLGKLLPILEIDLTFIEAISNLDYSLAMEILKSMDETKKKTLTVMMHQMAHADGNADFAEWQIIVDVFDKIGMKS
jgi:uncharacterized tellurite resistance protein B-like protein